MTVAFSPAVMLSLVLRLLGSPSAPNLALSGGCLSNWLLAVIPAVHFCHEKPARFPSVPSGTQGAPGTTPLFTVGYARESSGFSFSVESLSRWF